VNKLTVALAQVFFLLAVVGVYIKKNRKGKAIQEKTESKGKKQPKLKQWAVGKLR